MLKGNGTKTKNLRKNLWAPKPFLKKFCDFSLDIIPKGPRMSPITKGAFVWDQSGIRIIGIMQISVCLGAILIPEYLDFHSGYSAPRSRIAGRARIMTSLFPL